MIGMLSACAALLDSSGEAVRATGCASPRIDDGEKFASSRNDVYGANTDASAAPSDAGALPQAAVSSLPAADETKPRKNELTFAIGVGSVPTYLGSNDRIIFPGLGFRGKLKGYAFSSRGTNLSVDLIRDRKGSNTDISFGPYVNYRADRTRGIEDVQVLALGKSRSGMEVGGSIGIRQKHVLLPGYDTLALRVRVLKEVGKGHGSHVITPTIEYGAALHKTVFVGLTASMDYVGKGFGRNYYNVTPMGSAASGLPVYSAAGAKSGWLKTSFNIAAAKSLSGDLRGRGWTLLAFAGTSKLRGRYAASPIVALAGSPRQKIGGMAMAYTF